MVESTITANGVGKSYSLRRNRMGRRAGSVPSPTPTDDPNAEFWALRDVTFAVAPGSLVGIIGRNGAGKSTLLKILSRITEPTTGRIVLNGRVASLLEVGTGFHPELTGRENIFLSGSINGMKRAEIRKHFDEIVAFSEVEAFLDTPVKRYSSGMYVRLAFAVAAHMQCEILILDEVLAVGDSGFQRKCLGKMNSVAHQGGKTVLFVSHSLPTVAALCDRGILLSGGRVVVDGTVQEAVAEYQRTLNERPTDIADLTRAEHYGNGKARYTSMRIGSTDEAGHGVPWLVTGRPLVIELDLTAVSPVTDLNSAVVIYGPSDERLIDVNTQLAGVTVNLVAGDRMTVKFELSEVLLRPGDYEIGIWLGRSSVEDVDGILKVCTLHVEPDVRAMKSSSVFPGYYQCRFHASVTAAVS